VVVHQVCLIFALQGRARSDPGPGRWVQQRFIADTILILPPRLVGIDHVRNRTRVLRYASQAPPAPDWSAKALSCLIASASVAVSSASVDVASRPRAEGNPIAVNRSHPGLGSHTAFCGLPTDSNGGAPGERSVRISRIGGCPKNRLYSRLNWLALSYPTSKAAVAASSPSTSMRLARMILNMLQLTQRSELAQPGRSAVWGLMSAVEGQTDLPGRKSILLFSSGFGVPQGMEEPWKMLISTANRFNVTFYSIDARGLDTAGANDEAVAGLKDASSASRASAMTGAGTVTPAMANGIDTAINAGKSNGQDTLADLAQSTGGFLIANSNDFREGLRKVSEDIESYYEVTYNPQITSYDGSYRKIEVRSSRAGLRIHSRAGYFALPASAGNREILAPYEIPLMRALNNSPLPHSFDFQSAGLHFRGPHEESTCSVVLDIPLASVTLRQANAQNPYQGDLAYVAIVKSMQGEVVEKFRGNVPLAGAAAQVQTLKNSHFIFSRNLPLPPGRYTLEAAVIDRMDNRISARKSGFLVPESQSKLEISSVVMVRSVRDQLEATSPDDPFQVGAKVITPSLGPVAKTDPQGLRFYMVIFADRNNSRKPELMMKFSRDGVPVGSGSALLPEPDAGGRIQYVASAFPGRMESGNYEAQFFVLQGAETVSQTVAFTLN